MAHTRFLVFLLILSFSALISQPVWSCSCEPPPPPVEALQQADVVFAGTVVSKELRETEPQWFVYFVSLEVSSSWKGLVKEEMVVTTNSDSLGSFCGYFFEEGQDYLIYGYEENEGDPIFTGLCTRTKLLEEAQDEIAVLNRATAIEPSPWGTIKVLIISIISP